MNNHKHIRIFQVTDSHISADDSQQWFGRQPDQCLKTIINNINNDTGEESITLATGDLSHDGSEQSYKNILNHMSRLSMPVYCLPGNHDKLGNMNKFLNQGNVETGSHLIKNNWLIIMINTLTPGEEHGSLSEIELKRIENLLAEHKNKFVLIAMHHPPIDINCAWIDRKKLSDSKAFMETISRYQNIRAVISGHVHQQSNITVQGVQYFSTPSSCHQYLPGSEEFAVDNIEPGYRRIDMHDDGSIHSDIVRVAIDEYSL